MRDRLKVELLSLWDRTDETMLSVTHSNPEAINLFARLPRSSICC